MIKMKEIYNLLKTYKPELRLSQKDFDTVNNIVWLRKYDQDYQPNLLYVGKASNLEKIRPIESPLNVICLGDIPLTFDTSNLNLIVVDPASDLTKIYFDVKHFIINKTNFDNSCTKLYDALVSGKGLQHIINMATKVLGNPIMVYNLAYKILGASNKVPVKDPLWNEMVTKGYGNFDHYKSHAKEFKKVNMTDEPVILDFGNMHGFIAKIRVAGKCVGYISSIDCFQSFGENDLQLMQLLQKLIAVELQKDNVINQTKGLMYEQLIIELLNTKNPDQKYLEDRINFLDLNLKENLYVLTVRQKAAGTDSLPLYRERLDALIYDSKSLIYNNDLIFLITRNKNRPLTESNLADALEFFKENNMQAGLSRCFQDISSIRHFYIQAHKAIEIGSHIESDQFLFIYDKYAYYHLLDITSEQANLKDFVSNFIFDLIEYDKVNNTKFTQTLYVYLTCGSDIAKTARIFNIHRNTLDYRIKKVEEILEIDLKDAEIHFALYSSFKILSFIKDVDFLASIN